MANVLDRIMDGVKTREGKIVAVLLTLSLSLMAWNVSAITAFADEIKDEPPADIIQVESAADGNDDSLDAQAGSTDLVQPAQPNVEGLATSDANAAIASYNDEVDTYNAAATQENANRQAQYEQAVAEAEAHNAAEDAKVEQNKADLAKQEERENLAKKHEQNTQVMSENRTTNPAELPTDWSGNVSSNPQTIIVEKAEGVVNEALDAIKYRIINIHLYLDEENEGTYWGTNIKDEIVPDDESWTSYTVKQSFEINQSFKDHLVLAEWEIAEATGSDVASLTSEHKVVGYKSEAFYRYLPGYYNGFWIGTNEVAEIDHRTDYDWDQYGAQVVKAQYDSPTYEGNVINLFSMWVYSFIRLGDEPVVVNEYTPSYKDVPAAPTFLDMLEHMALLDPDPTPAPVPGTDPEPTPAPADTPSTTPEPAETPTEATTPVAPVAPQATPAATPAAATPAAAAAVPTVAAVAAAPAAVAPAAQAAAPATVADNPTPLANGEAIEDDANALASGQQGSWSLFDLVCTVVTALVSLVLLVGVFGRSRKDEDDEAKANANAAYASEEEEAQQIKRRRALRVASLVPAIGAIALLLLTQDFTQPMAIFDIWSLTFGIIALVQFAVAILSHKKKQDDTDDEQKQSFAPAAA